MKKAIINDVNEDLVNVYKVIASEPNKLITILQNYQNEFHSLEDCSDEKKMYYSEKRETYNLRVKDKIEQAALFIFLNRTCFNGLYRVNRNNGYNVPMGSYKKPMICDEENIRAVNEVLEKVEILSGDYKQTLHKAEGNSFFYLDPPYKPISTTSSFNSYSADIFDDREQIRLRDFCLILEKQGYRWMLSNSDVKNQNPDNTFFDDIYSPFNISRIKAKRSINANVSKRGELNELLIVNYK